MKLNEFDAMIIISKNNSYQGEYDAQAVHEAEHEDIHVTNSSNIYGSH